MNRRRTFAPEIEVSGGNILALLAAMGAFRARGEELLAEQGISSVVADGWYPLGGFLAALESISRGIGPHTLFQIGRQIPDYIFLPARVNSFEDTCAAFDSAFHLNHRGGDAGGIGYQVTGSRSATIITSTPYPCDFDRGVIQGFFQRFMDSRVSVVHDAQRACKALGGASCTYQVRL